MKVFLVTIDIQKAFDSLDLNSLICTLENTAFVKCLFYVLIRNQESCVTNGFTTTKYLSLGRTTVQVTQFQLLYLL